MPHARYPHFALWRITLARWALYTLLGIAALVSDPFGLSQTTHEASRDAIYRVIAPLYESNADDRITVVLISEEDIQSLYSSDILQANEWPLLYQDWRSILRLLGQYEPHAVFFDILFEKERSTDETLGQFLPLVDHYDSQFPIIFAAGAPPVEGGLLKRLDHIASLGATSWVSTDDSVPLIQQNLPSAALLMYQYACAENGQPFAGCSSSAQWTQSSYATRRPMSIYWSSVAKLPFGAHLEGLSASEYCQNTASGFGETIKVATRNVFHGLLPEHSIPSDQQCLPFDVADLSDLFWAHEQNDEALGEQLKAILNDRIVLVGTHITGLPDLAPSPVLGQVPGAALHAMQLDNLLTYGDDYLRTPGTGTTVFNLLVWAGVVAVLVLWIQRRERLHRLRRGTPGELFRGWHSLVFLSVGSSLILIAALSSVYFLRVEPVNAVAFLGLLEIIRRIHIGWEKTFIERLRALWQKLWRLTNSTIKGS